MVWNTRDQLASADLGGGGDVYFTYDAQGQRARKVHVHNGSTVDDTLYLASWERYRRIVSSTVDTERETLHVSDDVRRMALVETLTVDGGTTVSSPTSRLRLQLDNHLGSSLLELTEDADIISYEEYHPYGTTAYHAADAAVEVSAKRYRYTGEERDEETGFGYHGARYYAPWLGRWTAADPAGMVDGPSLYVYVSDRPVALIDPTGYGEYLDESHWAGYGRLTLTGGGGVLSTAARAELAAEKKKGPTDAIASGLIDPKEESTKFIAEATSVPSSIHTTPIASSPGAGVASAPTGAPPGVLGDEFETTPLFNSAVSSANRSWEMGAYGYYALNIGLGVLALPADAALLVPRTVHYGLDRFPKVRLGIEAYALDYGLPPLIHGGFMALELTLRLMDASRTTARLAAAVAAGAENVEGAGLVAAETRVLRGEFSIIDWTRYPEPPSLRPPGPFRLLEGAEYEMEEAAKTAANRALHRSTPGFTGYEIHEIHPVKFGGSPTALSNKLVLPGPLHDEYTVFWNRLMLYILRTTR
jgi:RHS repeat-associated protein